MSIVKEYKCLNCKAGLEFSPALQKWKCKYCFSEFTKEELDKVYKEDLSDKDQPDMESYYCTSCGAELITDSNVAATVCIYCKNPTIIKSRFSGSFKPKSVIPFKLTKDDAKKLYAKWIKKRIFAPKEFKEKENIDKITGLYAPYWLFDTTALGRLEGDATTVKTWTRDGIKFIQTNYYYVVREAKANYKRVPVDGSKKLTDSLMNKIEPYDYKDLTDFSMHYMAGFLAEKYDVDAEEAGKTARKRIEDFMASRLNTTVKGYKSFVPHSTSIKFENLTPNYAMLPIYLLINKYKGKNHEFIVNGQTGKIAGNTPINHLKQLAFAVSVFGAVWFLLVFGGALIA